MNDYKIESVECEICGEKCFFDGINPDFTLVIFDNAPDVNRWFCCEEHANIAIEKEQVKPNG